MHKHVGTVHFARVGDSPAFNNSDIADLGALCLHLSATLAKLQTRVIKFNSPDSYRLTNRELQIAELVATGLTNAEIGAKIWITEYSVKQALKRIFRKLSVTNRTQMVARLQDISGKECK